MASNTKKLYTLGLTQKKGFGSGPRLEKHLIHLFHQAKKVVLFPEIDRVSFFYHSPACIVECVSEYIFLISKKQKKNKNNTKQSKTRRQKKAKETKEKIICGKFNGKRLYSLRICSVFF